MTTQAISGVGAELQYGDGASVETFTKFAEVNRIAGPTMVRNLIRATSLDSTGGYEEYIPGLRDGGEVTANANYRRDSYDTLLADFESDTARNYRIVLPDTDGTTFEFAGFIMQFPLTIPPDDKVTYDITIKITGPVELISA